MEQALQRYALLEHIMDDAPSTDPGWIQLGSVVLNWISNSISADLHQVVREHDCTVRHLWLAIENQFLDNREHRTLHLDGAFPLLFRVTSRSMSTAASSTPWSMVWLTSAHPLTTGSLSSISFRG
jgi:hypothetical protein